MSKFPQLRQWINRDDGRRYRIGNRNLGTLETVGLLTFICSLFLWQLHSKVGLSGMWAYCAGVAGFLLVCFGLYRAKKGPGA